MASEFRGVGVAIWRTGAECGSGGGVGGVFITCCVDLISGNVLKIDDCFVGSYVLTALMFLFLSGVGKYNLSDVICAVVFVGRGDGSASCCLAICGVGLAPGELLLIE